MNYIIASDPKDMAQKAADILFAQVLLKPNSVLGLATGSTPLGVYESLIERYKKGELSFKNVSTVNLDEYCGLPGTSKDSYRYYMDTKLFNHIDIDPKNTHLPDGLAKDPAAECARYDELISSLGGIDMQLLGIGMNGHIGFNEPQDSFVLGTNCVELTQNTREVNSVYFDGGLDEMPTHALTMGMREIMHAKRVLLVAGANKKDIVEKALNGPVTPNVPASILQLHKRLTVVLAQS